MPHFASGWMSSAGSMAALSTSTIAGAPAARIACSCSPRSWWLNPDVLVGITTPAAAALKAQTQTIPIVFTVVSDPVGSGFVLSLAKPGGNLTGFINIEASLSGKWLELLRDTVECNPRAYGGARHHLGQGPQWHGRTVGDQILSARNTSTAASLLHRSRRHRSRRSCCVR